MSILITGFEPFGGDAENPARLAARAAVSILKSEGHDAHFLEVPCVFATAAPTVEAEAKRVGAEIVICAGLAARRKAISLEDTAKNIMDARIPDNAGGQPRGQEVVQGGKAILGTRLPVEKAREAIQHYAHDEEEEEDQLAEADGMGDGGLAQHVLAEERRKKGVNGDKGGVKGKRKRKGIPVEISHDAGEFVCNALMYATLHDMDESVSVGFVHVPLFKEVSLDDQAEALAIVARETVSNRVRLRKVQGKCRG